MQTKSLSGFALSPQQKRLWSLQQESSAYLTQCAILLEGALKPEVLKAALQRVINRHEVLRTTFRRRPGVKTPVMVVADNSYPLWQEINLSDGDNREHAAKIDELFQETRCQAFDFEQSPLLRLSLLKLSENLHIWHVALPALCADTWTIKNLVTEISNSYHDCLKGEESWDEVVQYLKFSEWQNQLLEDEETEAAEGYWRQRKLSSLSTLRLPFESNSLKRSGFTPECLRLAIASDVSLKIETLAQKYDTSAAVVLLACWQTLIWRLTKQSDIIIGTASARREYEELHDVLGLCATWLPIRCHLTPDLRFAEVLELADQAISDAEEWQDYFVPEPVENDNTLAFPIGFEFEELPEKRLAAGISFSLYQQESFVEQFKIKLVSTQHNDSLSAVFYYDVNQFCTDTIQRLAGQFQTLLANATEHPDVVISQLEVLNRWERQKLLVEFNQTQVDYPLDKCIHQLFEQQVLATPDNIAVVFEDQQLTYTQLNTRANQLAHYLVSLGVGPETLVALCVERSLEMLIGLLGIIKAGAAYLPLDPQLPTERLNFLLQDASASAILTQQHLQGQLPQQAAPVVCLDSHLEALAQQPTENLPAIVTVENLVYVIYTSGSTGQPKGVAVEHRQLLNYLHTIVERLELPVGSSYATVSTLAADLGNTVIFASLCTGGCLHIISQHWATHPQALADYCTHYPIDCLKIVPSHLSALISGADPEKILPRACLILGGEASSWQLIEKISPHAPLVRIFNHYGPTEATVGVLTYQVQPNQGGDTSATLPIGRPLGNVQIYLLDEHLHPVPMGVAGEIYIGGASLARGYLNQAQLTRQKFIPNPFSDSPSARLYKTGDLGRYLSDGNIEFLGRIDNQVKIRGFRIELAEIEAVLNQHPQVLSCVVIATEDVLEERRLVAYLVAQQQPAPTISDLRSFLKQKLPEYMVPSFFMMLDALPLTANGKVDRRALPVPQIGSPQLKVTFVAPRTEIEDILAGIWASVLKVERVGIYDNFFELGGHSLLATQLMVKIQQKFGKDLPLASLFQSPTIEQLASLLNQQTNSQPSSPLVLIQPGGNQPPFFCVHPVGGNVLCYEDLARHLGFGQPFYGLQAPGLNGEQEPFTRIEDMAAHYIEALQTIQSQGPYKLGGWSSGGVVAFEMAQQLYACGHEVSLLALIDSYAPTAIKLAEEIDVAMLVASFARNLGSIFGKELPVSVDELRQLCPEEQFNHILELGKMVNILPPEVGQQQVRQFWQVFKANHQAISRYIPQPYLGRITLFCAAQEVVKVNQDPSLGWGKLAAGGLETHKIPSDHSTIVLEPHVQVLAEQLGAYFCSAVF